MTTQALQPEPAQRLDDLAEIIRAYNEVTQNLQRSHESLQGEVVRLREQLASTDAQLQRSKRLAALGEMAAGIAHEVRNPLAAIGLYARMIVEDLDGLGNAPLLACAADNGRKIASAVRGLDAVVNDVLSFARDLAPRLTSNSSGDLLRRALEAHQPAIEAGQIEVHWLPDEAAVLADADLLHQALVNLIRNAIEAMNHKGTRVLTLGARREGAQVVLVVRDTGPGIAPENIDRIFNPFFTTRNTGTGLGLAIVHRIVDAHGGAIAVHNDAGAVFELVIAASGGATSRSGRRAAALLVPAEPEPIGAIR